MATPRQVRPGWEFGYLAEGTGIEKGIGLVIGADQLHAKKAAALGAGAWRGVALQAGRVNHGTADATIPDEATAQKQGIAQALVPAASSAAAGDQAIVDANGRFIKRAPYSFSAFVWGQFDESFTAGAAAEWRALELVPCWIELVRQVTGYVSTIGAVTKYVNGIGGAIAAAPVPMYLVRTTGEAIRNLRINLGTAPGGSDTVAVTIYKSSDNGATWSATTLTCTATGTAKTASDATHAPTLSAGDLLAIYVDSSASTAADLTVTFDAT